MDELHTAANALLPAARTRDEAQWNAVFDARDQAAPLDDAVAIAAAKHAKAQAKLAAAKVAQQAPQRSWWEKIIAWLYTGDANASDEVLEAAKAAAGEALFRTSQKLQPVVETVSTVDPTPVSGAVNAGLLYIQARDGEAAQELLSSVTGSAGDAVKLVRKVGKLAAQMEKVAGARGARVLAALADDADGLLNFAQNAGRHADELADATRFGLDAAKAGKLSRNAAEYSDEAAQTSRRLADDVWKHVDDVAKLPTEWKGVKIHWPTKPPDKNGGHWNKIVELTRELAESGKYTEIYVNKWLKTGTEGAIDSQLRPDLLLRRADGKFDVIEVVSPSQTSDGLWKKIEVKFKPLLGELFGEGNVIKP